MVRFLQVLFLSLVLGLSACAKKKKDDKAAAGDTKNKPAAPKPGPTPPAGPTPPGNDHTNKPIVVPIEISITVTPEQIIAEKSSQKLKQETKGCVADASVFNPHARYMLAANNLKIADSNGQPVFDLSRNSTPAAGLYGTWKDAKQDVEIQIMAKTLKLTKTCKPKSAEN